MEFRTKPEFLICKALQASKKDRTSGSAQSLQNLKRAPPLPPIYGKSEVHTEEDEPEWLASAPTDNEQLVAESMAVMIRAWDEMMWWKGIFAKHPVSGILHYIRELKPQLDIFCDAAFASFCQTLDAEVKCWKAGGLGVHTKQAKPITPD